MWEQIGDGDQDQEEKEAEDEDAQEDIRSSSFPQRITRTKFKELGSNGQMFSLFVVSFV